MAEQKWAKRQSTRKKRKRDGWQEEKEKKNNSIWVTDKEAIEKKKYASLGASF